MFHLQYRPLDTVGPRRDGNQVTYLSERRARARALDIGTAAHMAVVVAVTQLSALGTIPSGPGYAMRRVGMTGMDLRWAPHAASVALRSQQAAVDRCIVFAVTPRPACPALRKTKRSVPHATHPATRQGDKGVLPSTLGKR